MSTPRKSSLEVAQYPSTKFTEDLRSLGLSEYKLPVSEELGLNIYADQITEVSTDSVTVQGCYNVGDLGKPSEDSFAMAKKIVTALQHQTCLTGETEGSPVWFENAAWCNNCKVLHPADNKYVGEIECSSCRSSFPHDGLMRATVPSVLVFEEVISFPTHAQSVDELIQLTTDVMGL